MKLRKLFAVMLAFGLIAAACGDDAEDTTTTTAAPTTTTVAIGSADAPIQVLFVPSVNMERITSGGELIADAFKAATGLEFEVVIPTSYAATIEAMCAAPERSLGFIPGLGYVLASELCGVDVSMAAVRFGWPVYFAQFITLRDSGLDTLADLDGKTWAYPDAGSTSGYLAPLPMLADAGVTVANEVSGIGHTGTVRAVYNGEADFGTTFFSPPLLPEGRWEVGMEPDIPDEFIPECAVTPEDRLFCGDYRVLDARSSLRTEAPDVVQKVQIIAISPPIPNDTLSFGPLFPAALRTQIEDALMAFAETEAWDESLGHADMYEWSGLAPAMDADFDPVRASVALAGISLENIGE
jgi:phosphonate transport system substrate-binding protein